MANKTKQAFTDLVDMCFAGGVDSLMQFGGIDFDFLAESLARRGQVSAGFWWTVNYHQLPWLHLIDDLFDGVAIRAAFVIYVSYLRSVERTREKSFSTA